MKERMENNRIVEGDSYSIQITRYLHVKGGENHEALVVFGEPVESSLSPFPK